MNGRTTTDGATKRWALGFVAVIAGATVLAGCRGGKSEDPPFHLIPDMQWQAHRGPQSESKLFDDKRSNRLPSEHTLSRGRSRLNTQQDFLKDSDAIYKGVDTAGNPLPRIPLEVTPQLLERGEERFNIYCSPCHDKTGSGNGLISQHAPAEFGNLPNFAEEPRLQQGKMADGEIFQTISLGKNNRMPSYAAQINERDRWAIVAWVRVLQQSQHAPSSDAKGTKIEAAESETK